MEGDAMILLWYVGPILLKDMNEFLFLVPYNLGVSVFKSC